MKRFALIALLLASPAAADTFKTPFGAANGDVPECYTSDGRSVVPCGWSDLLPTITKPFAPSQPTDRSQVVTVSPNSGATNPYPAGATPTTAVGTGTTGAVTATMAAVPGRTNWVCQVQISAIGGTATIGPVTITGLKGGNTLTYQLASTAAGNYLPISFFPCFPASAINTAIAAATTADGTASAVDVNILGYVQ